MTPDDPTSYNHPHRLTLIDADCGQLGAALLALTRELWVINDRMMVMEEVLAKRGIDISAEIDALQPDETLRRRMDERGAMLVASVMDALAGLPKD
jgi:hypothetical protein